MRILYIHHRKREKFFKLESEQPVSHDIMSLQISERLVDLSWNVLEIVHWSLLFQMPISGIVAYKHVSSLKTGKGQIEFHSCWLTIPFIFVNFQFPTAIKCITFVISFRFPFFRFYWWRTLLRHNWSKFPLHYVWINQVVHSSGSFIWYINSACQWYLVYFGHWLSTLWCP